MANIQTVFNRHAQKGMPGQLARPNAPYDFDLGVAGVEVRPGDGVYYSASTNKFIKPTTTAARKLVTHIVSYDPTSFNYSFAGAANNTTEVVFDADAIIKIACLGSFFVQAGETLENGDDAIYNQSTGKWIKYAAANPASPVEGDLRPVPFIFYLDPLKTVGDGDIVEVKIPSRIYNFPVQIA